MKFDRESKFKSFRIPPPPENEIWQRVQVQEFQNPPPGKKNTHTYTLPVNIKSTACFQVGQVKHMPDVISDTNGKLCVGSYHMWRLYPARITTRFTLRLHRKIPQEWNIPTKPLWNKISSNNSILQRCPVFAPSGNLSCPWQVVSCRFQCICNVKLDSTLQH